MSTLLFIIATVIALLTTYCSHQDSNNDPAYAPEINPHPKYFMTVEWETTSNADLTWLVTYRTSNPDCEKNINWLEGISVDRTRKFEYRSPNTSKAEIPIPLDYYLKGKCNWVFQDISYQVGTSLFVTFAYYDPNAKSNNYSASSRVSCNNFNCVQIERHDFSPNLAIPIANYSYKLLISGTSS